MLMLLGAAAFGVWLYFYLRGKKHNAMFEVLEEKDFPFKEVYGLGYAVLEQFKYGYKSKSDRKLRPQLEVLYGPKYSEYYLRVIHAQQITIALTVFVIAFALYGLSGEVLACVLGIGMAGLAYYYFGTVTSKKILKRSNELMHDFSEAVSKLALLTNAGMILRDAWEEVSANGDGVFYKEMQQSVLDMQNGMAEIDAIYAFGMRCMVPEIKKFTSTIIQGMTKGNQELTLMLQEQSKEVWDMKKQLVRREGEKASSRLLIPICIMFVGILVMILIPIFTNLGI